MAIADTHLGLSGGRTANGRKFIYNSMFDAFDQILSIAKEQKFDYVLHAGDVFNRSKPPRQVIDRAFKSIEDLLAEDIGFIMVPGNHDRSKLPETLLTYIYDNFHIIRALENIQLDDANIIGFPFTRSNGTDVLEQASKHAERQLINSSIILCHQTFEGSWFGPQKFYFLGNGALNTTKLSPKVRFVVAGHIHRAQKVQKDRVFYTGSTARASFAECIEPKGYLDITIERDYHKIEFKEIESIPMEVVEINWAKTSLMPSDIEDQLPKPSVRTLLRLTGRRTDDENLQKLFQFFYKENWPLLTITPRSANNKLRPLYNNFNEKFLFESTESK
ncbi:MAG: metallophosphoesterase family protein [Candidatus Kariarchaeaceae archaeon]|jgi:DNA repair exonuclease SbcCD nuclease subunit